MVAGNKGTKLPGPNPSRRPMIRRRAAVTREHNPKDGKKLTGAAAAAAIGWSAGLPRHPGDGAGSAPRSERATAKLFFGRDPAGWERKAPARANSLALTITRYRKSSPPPPN